MRFTCFYLQLLNPQILRHFIDTASSGAVETLILDNRSWYGTLRLTRCGEAHDAPSHPHLEYPEAQRP
jgi:hypothetical protein